MAVEAKHWFSADVFSEGFKAPGQFSVLIEDGPYKVPQHRAEEILAEEFSKANPHINEFRIGNSRWKTVYVRVRTEEKND